MTEKERLISVLQHKRPGGHVPHLEMVFYPTMEAFGKVHPRYRNLYCFSQMTPKEQRMQLRDVAQVYVDIAEKYQHSCIFVQDISSNYDMKRGVLEEIRNISGDKYFVAMHGDSTFAIPDGNTMMEFSVKMFEEPEELHDEAKQRLDARLEFAAKINTQGKLLDGFFLCSDYCFNTNPFYSHDTFDEFVGPYLTQLIGGYHDMGCYAFKHSDGNIMPLMEQIIACGPDAIHSLDPQGGVDLAEVVRLYGDRVALIGNVNCALLQTGTVEECQADVRRTLREGMQTPGFIFATSNCIYPGMPLERYEIMHKIWREEGQYTQDMMQQR